MAHPLAVEYPKAGRFVDGREVREKVPNMDSIEAHFGDEYSILRGVREVPLKAFQYTAPEDLFKSRDDIERVERLAAQIEESQEIAPLIIVFDNLSSAEGPWVLEGAHRLGALSLLGAKSLPAIIVIDDTEQSGWTEG